MLEGYKIKTAVFVYVIGVLLLMSAIHYCNTGETDSVYEQLAEHIIECQTGIEVDFSF